MKDKQLDCLFVTPSAASKLYQDLAKDISVKEPVPWTGMLAQSCRYKGFGVAILDMEVERLSYEATVELISCMDPKLVVFCCYGQNPNSSTASMTGATGVAEILRNTYPEYKICFVGPHVNALPFEVLERHPFVDIVLTNEGVYALHNLLASNLESDLKDINGIGYRKDGQPWLNHPERLVPQELLEYDLPGIAWDLLPSLDKYRTGYWQGYFKDDVRGPFASIYSSLGCPFTCLRGDTLVNTIYGKISIKELSEKYTTIPIYTYNQKTKEIEIADAINIQKTGINKKLVRIKFDDDTHIDCTPDHKFLCFDSANQHIDSKEFIVEAQDLKPKMRLRAYNEYTYDGKYKLIGCKSKNYYNARLVLEYKLGRKMTSEEEVHHIDNNRTNDIPDNLLLCPSHREHLKYHPNPHVYYTEESRKKLSESLKKYRAKPEIKEQRRLANLGNKNPNFKHGNRCGTKSKIKEINHKVLSVEWLDETDDVYCLSVPTHGWFFANNVLVKNCNFCMINIINRTDNDQTKSAHDFNTFRYWNPDFMIKQFDYLAENNVKYIKLADELFQLKPKHFLTLCDKIAERGYNFNIWSYTRVDTVKEQYLDRLQKAGIVWHAIGIESSEQSIRMEIDKGRFKDVNIREIVKMIHDRGMDVGANYIFGLGHDNFDTMQKTLELAIELNTVNANMYCATPLPGSPLYMQMKQQGWDLPKNYDEYSFLSYTHRPSPTANCTTEDILYFRDYAYRTYYEHPKFINMLATRFGQKAVDKNAEMNKIRLHRQLLEKNPIYKG